MTENVTLNFESETTRHKFGIPSVTGGISHVRTRINKLSQSTDSSFTGTTYVEGVVGQCRLHVFDSNFHFLHTRLSNLDGTYEINNIYNDGKFYIVCVSLNEECPAISGHLIPPTSSDVEVDEIPVLTLIGEDQILIVGERYKGRLLSAVATTIDPYDSRFDSSDVSAIDYRTNYLQTQNVGLFAYTHEHSVVADTGVLPTKTVDHFDKNATYTLSASNGCWSDDECDATIEFINASGDMIVYINLARTSSSSQFNHTLRYHSINDLTDLVAPRVGSYPNTGGNITFTDTSLIFTNIRTTNYNGDFTISGIVVDDIVGIRFSNVKASTHYLSANGCTAFVLMGIDADPFYDTGATALDSNDGNITNQITQAITKNSSSVVEVDSNSAGEYIITYSVQDSGGNIATIPQTISVIESYEDYILSLLPVAHYNLDELSGTVANDSSVNLNHGVYEGTPIFTSSSLFNETKGTSIQMDGSTDAISTPIQSFSGDYTLAFFVNVNNTSTQSLVRSFDRHIVQWNTNDTITFYQFTGAVQGQVITPALNLNETYHIVCKKEGTNNHVFVNGVKYSASGAVDIVDSNNFFIGRRPSSTSEHVGGYMDEVSFFDRALDDLDIINLFSKI